MSDDQNAAVYNYLRRKGASAFWADSAMGYIRQGLSTNVYFTVNVKDQRAIVKDEMVRRYSANLVVCIPSENPGIPSQSRTLRLVYTLDPQRRLAHQVKVK